MKLSDGSFLRPMINDIILSLLVFSVISVPMHAAQDQVEQALEEAVAEDQLSWHPSENAALQYWAAFLSLPPLEEHKILWAYRNGKKFTGGVTVRDHMVDEVLRGNKKAFCHWGTDPARDGFACPLPYLDEAGVVGDYLSFAIARFQGNCLRHIEAGLGFVRHLQSGGVIMDYVVGCASERKIMESIFRRYLQLSPDERQQVLQILDEILPAKGPSVAFAGEYGQVAWLRRMQAEQAWPSVIPELASVLGLDSQELSELLAEPSQVVILINEFDRFYKHIQQALQLPMAEQLNRLIDLEQQAMASANPFIHGYQELSFASNLAQQQIINERILRALLMADRDADVQQVVSKIEEVVNVRSEPMPEGQRLIIEVAILPTFLIVELGPKILHSPEELKKDLRQPNNQAVPRGVKF